MTADDVRERVARAMDALEPAWSAAFHEWVVSDSDDGPPEKPTTLDRADAALAALAGPEVVAGVAEVLREHTARPAGSPHCACGWRPAMYLNDTESDRQQHRGHQSEAVVEWITGRAG